MTKGCANAIFENRNWNIFLSKDNLIKYVYGGLYEPKISKSFETILKKLIMPDYNVIGMNEAVAYMNGNDYFGVGDIHYMMTLEKDTMAKSKLADIYNIMKLKNNMLKQAFDIETK